MMVGIYFGGFPQKIQFGYRFSKISSPNCVGIIAKMRFFVSLNHNI